jgi:hypothetical protein
MDEKLQESAREVERLIQKFSWRQQAREAERKTARRPDGRYVPAASRNRHIAEIAIQRQPVPGDDHAEFWVTYTGLREEWLRMREDPRMSEFVGRTCDPDALNGYVAFDKRHAPKVADGTGNIVQYIPVHGGVSYNKKDSYAAVWGFDTMHHRSENEPRTDPAWIVANCWILYRGLKLGAELWPEFRRAGRDRRAELAQQLLDLVEEAPVIDKLGFEALCNLMMGQVG